MGAVILSLLANTALSWFTVRSGAYSVRLIAVMCACWTIQSIGTISVFVLDDPTAGYSLIAIGAVGFVPMGILGVRGAREVRAAFPNEGLVHF